jgi:hypothetical protein
MDEAASIKVDSFKLTFDPSSLPQLRQFQPALVLIGQRDTAKTKSGFHLLAYNINTVTYETQSMTLENAWHYSIDHPGLFEEVADWVWSSIKGGV